MIRGLFVGVLGLTALQAVVGSDAAAGRVGGLFDGLAAGLNRALDPTVPLVRWHGDAGPVETPFGDWGGGGGDWSNGDTPQAAPTSDDQARAQGAPVPTRAGALFGGSQ